MRGGARDARLFLRRVDPGRYPGESTRIFRLDGGVPPRVQGGSALATDRGGCANRVARTVGVEVSASRKIEPAPIPHSLSTTATTYRKQRRISPCAHDPFEPPRQHG